MSDGLDEIQAIFFEECAEGLATAEEGLSAMASGDVSAEVIAGVSVVPRRVMNDGASSSLVPVFIQ